MPKIKKMNRDTILNNIRDTESNIKNWYRVDGESQEQSDRDLRNEKRYLSKLRSQVSGYGEERLKELLESIECF